MPPPEANDATSLPVAEQRSSRVLLLINRGTPPTVAPQPATDVAAHVAASMASDAHANALDAENASVAEHPPLAAADAENASAQYEPLRRATRPRKTGVDTSTAVKLDRSLQRLTKRADREDDLLALPTRAMLRMLGLREDRATEGEVVDGPRLWYDIDAMVLLVSYIRTRCGDEHNEEEYENVEMAEHEISAPRDNEEQDDKKLGGAAAPSRRRRQRNQGWSHKKTKRRVKKQAAHAGAGVPLVGASTTKAPTKDTAIPAAAHAAEPSACGRRTAQTADDAPPTPPTAAISETTARNRKRARSPEAGENGGRRLRPRK